MGRALATIDPRRRRRPRSSARLGRDRRGQGARLLTLPGRPSSWLTRDVLRVIAASSTWGFAFSSFYLLPKFLMTELDAGPAEIGTVMGMAGVATVLFTVLTATRIDRSPRRYAVACGSLCMSVAAFGFTAVHSIGWLIDVLRVLQGASYAFALTAVGTLIAELVPPDRLSQAFGLSGASMLVMNAIAPAVAEPIATAFGWRAVFLLAGFSAFASAMLALAIREPSARLPPTATTGDRDGLLAVLRRPLARHYAAITFVMGVTFGTVFTFESPYLLELGATRVRSFFIAYAIAAVLVRVVFGHVPDRHGRHRVAAISLAVYGTAVLGMAVARAGAFPALGALFGVAHGLLYPSLNAIAVTATPPHERARILAIFTGAFSLGLWIGPTALGFLADRFGYPPVFAIVAVTTFAAAAGLARSRELRAGG